MIKEYFNWKKSRSAGAKTVKMLYAAINGAGRKFRSVFISTLAILMAVSLAACGNSDGGNAAVP